MKCIICSTEKNVHKVKHLPFSKGQSGHVTLAEWTEYCSNCIREQGDVYTKQMDGILKSRQ